MKEDKNDFIVKIKELFNLIFCFNIIHKNKKIDNAFNQTQRNYK